MPELDFKKLAHTITLKGMEKKSTMMITIAGGIELDGHFYDRMTPKQGKHTVIIYIPQWFSGVVRIALTHPKKNYIEYNIDVAEGAKPHTIHVTQKDREHIKQASDRTTQLNEELENYQEEIIRLESQASYHRRAGDIHLAEKSEEKSKRYSKRILEINRMLSEEQMKQHPEIARSRKRIDNLNHQRIAALDAGHRMTAELIAREIREIEDDIRKNMYERKTHHQG